MKKIFTVLFTLLAFTILLAWSYVNRIDHEQPAAGELIVYINSDTAPGEGVAAEARWPSGNPTSYANTRDNGTSVFGSFLSGSANWKVTFNSGVLPNDMSLDYQVMGIGGDNNFYSHSGFNWTIDATLPVELTSFTAFTNSENITLKWVTATEVNNYGFNVERKLETGDWNKIEFINGHGNSNSPKSYSFIDNTITSGKYSYRLKQIDIDGTFEYSQTVEVDLGVPSNFELSQNYPNPFNPTTTISYAIPMIESDFGSSVQLIVYDMLGEEVATLVNEEQVSGNYNVPFDASKLSSGIYYYALKTEKYSDTKKMLLLK